MWVFTFVNPGSWILGLPSPSFLFTSRIMRLSSQNGVMPSDWPHLSCLCSRVWGLSEAFPREGAHCQVLDFGSTFLEVCPGDSYLHEVVQSFLGYEGCPWFAFEGHHWKSLLHPVQGNSWLQVTMSRVGSVYEYKQLIYFLNIHEAGLALTVSENQWRLQAVPAATKCRWRNLSRSCTGYSHQRIQIPKVIFCLFRNSNGVFVVAPC